MLLGECGQNDKRAKLVLLGCWLGWFLNFADRSLLSPLLPLIKDEMNLGYLGIGFLTTAFFIGYTITPVPGGYLADKFGAKKVIIPSVIGFGIVTVFTAFVKNPVSLAITRGVTGLFEGSFYSTAVGYVSAVFPKKNRGRAVAVYETGWTLGSMVGIFFATFMGAEYGWRSPWIFMIIPTLLVAAWFWKYVPQIKKEDMPAYQETLDAGGKEQGVFKDILKIRNAWIIFFLQFIANFGYWSINTFTPLYFKEVKGYSFIASGSLLAVMLIAGTLGSLLSGVISDKFGRRTGISLFYAAAGITWYGVLNSVTVTQTLCWAAISGFFITGLYPTILSWMTDCVPPNLTSAASGFGIMGAEVGAFVTPIIAGIVANSMGLGMAMNIYIGSYILGAIIVWIGREMTGGIVQHT
ncbi:MFS transporter [Pectinatus frisingensis]|jgi:MFS family permease|uniref:MFS transporter n=1 Tax=Pectinatus frisingensis TaxID=865 RepID=UPI0015F3ECC8|nr:MFS transporter [Pectinatus frisingensis]